MLRWQSRPAACNLQIYTKTYILHEFFERHTKNMVRTCKIVLYRIWDKNEDACLWTKLSERVLFAKRQYVP